MKKAFLCAAAVLALGACSQPVENAAPAANGVAPAAIGATDINMADSAAPATAPAQGPLEYLAGLLGADGRTSIISAESDLNGDSMNEFVVYVSGQDHCGSGGCRVIVLQARDAAWQIVMNASVSRLPIRLLDTSTNGWRDLGVTTGGGGVARGLARMRFNGTSYPDNPTAPPASPVGQAEGTVLIAEDAQSGPLT